MKLTAFLPHIFVAALLHASIVAVVPVALGGDDSDGDGSPNASRPMFERDVVPILEEHCFKCHGGANRKAGLDLRRRFSIVGGGDSGPAIVPGKPERSLLIEMLVDQLMPPEGERRLEENQVRVIRNWIAAGAPIDAAEERPLESGDTDAEISPEDREFWSFQPAVRPPVPAVARIDQVRTTVDAFLLEKLEAVGLAFNPDADKRVLLRRLCFDLHGLPPTPQQIDEFLQDARPDAYERLVDRLLNSPRYGERWGRHWLDVAGYADSDGYLEADRPRPEAWRYRDYVIRALNGDKPYDRFLLEQLAGDELEDWRRADELTAEMCDNLIATGFLRTASDPTYGVYKEPLECHKVMADTIQIVSSALLGMTIQCARCHAHKMEPVSQRDYYQLHAVLLASYDPQRWLVSAERTIPMASEQQLAAIGEHNRLADQRVELLNRELAALVERFQARYLDAHLASVPQPLRAAVEAALRVDPAKRSAEQKKLVARHAPGITLDETAIAGRFPQLRVEAERLRSAIAAEKALKKEVVQLRGLIDMDDKPAEAQVLVRGDFTKPGSKVEPGIPAVLASSNTSFEPEAGYKTTGRRKEFAEWLVDPRHPLTARVHVNRIWAHHFGRGLVATVANLGRSGSPPSHPALLDWLATELVAGGWSQKELHRLIVTSTAYRQTSDIDERRAAIDPENALLSRWLPRRHEGEVIRDTLLYSAGSLNLQMHGQPVPVVRKPDGEIVTNDDSQGNRRSVYLLVRRSQHPTLLDLFDTPRMEINCPQRDQSIVVTQALTLMNSGFAERIARVLAERVWHERPDDDARIDYTYGLLFGRSPSATERGEIADFLEEYVQIQGGERVEGAESLSADARAAGMRDGWFHLMLVLLNSNEFVFVH